MKNRLFKTIILIIIILSFTVINIKAKETYKLIDKDFDISNISHIYSKVDLKYFNFKDKNIKQIFDSNDNSNIKVIDGYKDLEVRSKTDNIYITADILYLKDGKLNHVNQYKYMDGIVELYKKNYLNEKLDYKKLTTVEQNRLDNQNKISYDYWDEIKYQKGGKLKLENPGFYKLSIRNQFHEEIQTFLLHIKERKKENHFKDIEKDNWYYKDVILSLDIGLINGKTNTQFDPNGNLTLAEAITLAVKSKAFVENEKFIENEAGKNWYFNALDKAIYDGIITPTSFKNYNKEIKRDEVAYIFANILDDKYYKDINNVKNIKDLNGGKYDKYIYKLYNSGILVGRDTGEFDPDKKITRAEAAIILNRLLIENRRIKL